MTAAEPVFLDYRMRGRAGDLRPGKHAARHAGSGGDFRGVRPFWQMPDARRIDIRRSLMDPAGTIMVRQTDQRTAMTLVVAVDVSRSMAPGDVAPLAAAASRSASRAGDAFGLVCFDETVRDDIGMRRTRRRGGALAAAAALAGFQPAGRSAEGMRTIATHLPSRRCLVLLVSDFLMPLPVVDAALDALARHDVVPIIIANMPAEPPSFGLGRVRDAESGRTRLLVLRPGLRRRWREAEMARRGALHAIFARHGRDPFSAGTRIDIAALSRHLAVA